MTITAHGQVVYETQVEAAVAKTLDHFGRIDVVINNAGNVVSTTATAPFEKRSLADRQDVIDINLTGVFLCTKAVLPAMLKQKQGRIINIASQSGQIGAAERAAYCTTKGGVISFTKAFAREVAGDGILVNCVAPGPVETDMIADLSHEWRKMMANSLPLGRFASPREIASSVVFLASSDGDVFVGQALGPNCGAVML